MKKKGMEFRLLLAIVVTLAVILIIVAFMLQSQPLVFSEGGWFDRAAGAIFS